jgi:MinD superfamily P-loop ATPase
MKEIVVLSGKGGVGKSSLTAALGVLLGQKHKLVFADTDVDAPNLHLVLDAELDSTNPITASDKAVIDYDLCSRCMECVAVCRFSSITGTEEPVIISYSCEGCGACTLVCPQEAITVEPVKNGWLNIFNTQAMRIVAGELGIGESSSGRLVDVVRRRARQEAELTNSDLLLTDGPPGIGCPVIASLKGVDYALLVTEPTPSALSDLMRVVEVTKFFKIPAGVVLNRAGMHAESRDKLLAFLLENGLDLLAEIPYDPLLPKALALGKPAVTLYPDAPSSTAIRALAAAVETMLAGE